MQQQAVRDAPNHQNPTALKCTEGRISPDLLVLPGTDRLAGAVTDGNAHRRSPAYKLLQLQLFALQLSGNFSSAFERKTSLWHFYFKGIP